MPSANFFKALTLLFALSPLSSGQTTTGKIENLCQDALKQWQVPGLALVIVKDERILFLKGFGVKKLGSTAPVGPDTLFPLASCTKSFTSLVLGMLADDGLLRWDDPVRKHVPCFKLSDPLADANVTLRDLLCHRTGVGSHDLLWYRSPWNLEERIRRAGHLELQYSFRSHFQYQTVLFGAAGLAAGNAAKTTWQDLVTRRILIPLEMKHSSCTAPNLTAYPDQASPHKWNREGKVEGIARYPLQDPDPAGSLHSTARDLARYLRFHLSDGTWQGHCLISPANLEETHVPQMIVRREGFARVMNPDTCFLHYGLGWIIQDYRDHSILLHGGAIDGFRSHITLVPQARLGLALLNNLDGTFMNLALSQTLLDLFLGLPAKDWNGYYLDLKKNTENEKSRHQRELLANRKKGTRPSLPLTGYVGNYHEPAFGSGRICLENDSLTWNWGKIHCPLEHLQDDTFLANNDLLIDAIFEFGLNPQKEVTSLKAMDRQFRRLNSTIRK